MCLQVEEFGAINMTGLRIVQYNTPLARDFFPRYIPPPGSDWRPPELGLTVFRKLVELVALELDG